MRAKEFLSEKNLNKADFLGKPGADQYEINRKQVRLDNFLNKILKGSPFEVIGGQPVIIKNDPALINSIKSRQIPNILPIEPEGTIRLSKLSKTAEFGGETSDHRMKAENSALTDLDSKIKSLLNGSTTIPLQVGNVVVNAAGARKTPGNPKSDIEIIDNKGKSVAWISHKKGSPADPKHFGQWGGISKFVNHEEVQAFAQAVAPNPPAKRQTAYSRSIKDTMLQKKSVYGIKFGSDQYGIDNVNTVLQGSVKIVKDGNKFKLVADRELQNGDDFPEAYVPVLTARYISDRNDMGIPQTRISIYPAAGRKIVGI